MFILTTVTLIIWVNLTNSISSRITQNIDIGDKICNVQHVSGGFIWGTALVWPQRLFINLEAASTYKSTQMLSYG